MSINMFTRMSTHMFIDTYMHMGRPAACGTAESAQGADSGGQSAGKMAVRNYHQHNKHFSHHRATG